MISRVAVLLATTSRATAAPDALRGAAHGNSSLARLLQGDAEPKFRKVHQYDLSTTGEFEVIEIPDKDLTHSCSNYTKDGTTVFSRDGNLVLKVASACESGQCLNSGR